MDFSVLNGYYGVLMEGTKYTILVSLVSLVVGFVLGLLICLMKMSNFKVLKLLSSAYVQILRGTPLFVQVFIIYFGLAPLNPGSIINAELSSNKYNPVLVPPLI